MQSSEEKALADILLSSRKRNDNSNVTVHQNNHNNISSHKTIINSNRDSPTIENSIDGSSNDSDSNNILIKNNSNSQSQAADESLRHLKSMLLLSSSADKNQQTISKAQSVGLLKECLIGAKREQNTQIPNIAKSSTKISKKSVVVPTSPTKVSKNPDHPVAKDNSKSSTKYASSKLLMSPEPVSVPMPDFDESFFS